jgi:deazaflavin-dependent oxidoreductase (nitroreductase family)
MARVVRRRPVAVGDRRRLYERIMVRLAASSPGAWLFVNVLTHVDRLLIRMTRGRVSTAIGSRFHRHVVLLTTTGARTGRPRMVPLLALLGGSRVVLIASRGGHPQHPGWYHNLRACAQATVTVHGRTDVYVAREAEGAERAELWQRAVAFYPGYAEYQARAGRRIPVMVLERADHRRC